MSTAPDDSARQDAGFREAVSAIDAGDLAKLEGLAAANPALVRRGRSSPQWQAT